MEAKLVAELPRDVGWQFEPKWDGFRAIASRAGDSVDLISKSGKSLARYFPEIVQSMLLATDQQYVLDTEIILPIGDFLSFEALQARLHPAGSRILKLSKDTPAKLMVFDCLSIGEADYVHASLSERRKLLVDFRRRQPTEALLLSPATVDEREAIAWLERSGGALDGVVAKKLDMPYQAGERAMLKVKPQRTADCVVGGFRRGKDGALVGSLLLGLYDETGTLNHVGFTSALSGSDKVQLTAKLDTLIEPPGFTGKAPGGRSRWNQGEEREWYPLKAELVVEVGYDQVTGDRFRHGTKLLRWRPDKAPSQCRMEQLQHALRPSELAQIM